MKERRSVHFSTIERGAASLHEYGAPQQDHHHPPPLPLRCTGAAVLQESRRGCPSTLKFLERGAHTRH